MRQHTHMIALFLFGGVFVLGLLALAWMLGPGASQAEDATMHNCPQVSKWTISVWSGDDGTDAEQAFATCNEGGVAAAYSLDPDTQAWSRWFADRPDISTLTVLNDMQGVIARSELSQTEVNVIQPSALSVVQEIEGHCWVGSLTTVRPDAWRCMDDFIHDPCLSESDTDAFVICPTGPPQDMTGVKMNLTEPLPLSYGHDQEDLSYAWILELVDGTACTFVAGATGVIDGERVNYMCSDGWWIVGFPEVGTVWTVHKVLMSETFDEPIAEAEAAVVTVWR